MEENSYKSSILLWLQLVLFVGLTWFTVVTTIDYTRNVNTGIAISVGIVLFYLFVLYRSAVFLKRGRIGLAYFLTITFFLMLSFAQMVNCSNSIRWH